MSLYIKWETNWSYCAHPCGCMYWELTARVWFPWRHARFLWWLKPLSFFFFFHVIFVTDKLQNKFTVQQYTVLPTRWTGQPVFRPQVAVWKFGNMFSSLYNFSQSVYGQTLWDTDSVNVVNVSSSYFISSANDIHPYLSYLGTFLGSTFKLKEWKETAFSIFFCPVWMLHSIWNQPILGPESLKSI